MEHLYFFPFLPAINQFCRAITGLSKVPNYKVNITLVARDQNSSNAVPEKCLHLHLCTQLDTSQTQTVQNKTELPSSSEIMPTGPGPARGS